MVWFRNNKGKGCRWRCLLYFYAARIFLEKSDEFRKRRCVCRIELNSWRRPSVVIKSKCLTTSGLTKVNASWWGHCPNACWTLSGIGHPLPHQVVFDHPHSKEFFLMPGLFFPWRNSVLFPGAELDISLCDSPSQAAAESSEITSWPPLLQDGQPRCPQPLFILHDLQY